MMSEKLAETTYPIHELLRSRWSPRAFADKLPAPEQLLSLMEAARWAPSSNNEQPWSFIVATKQSPIEFAQLLDCLVEGNRVWAQQAPVLMLSVARLRFQEDEQLNRHALHDVGLAVGNLLCQATALGLMVHQMAGFDAEKARRAFRIPSGFEPVAAMAVGYHGDPDNLPERLRERERAPRSRKDLADFVFAGKWCEPSPLLSRGRTAFQGMRAAG